MILYDFEGNVVKDVPKKVFRGLDVYKDKSDGIIQIERILKDGRVPSHALIIHEGNFDFERLSKHASPWQINNEAIQKYVAMIQEDSLNPSDIDDDLRYHHWMYLPTPLVSVSSSIAVATRYSGWALRPVLVYKTDNLEGVDFRREPQDNDKEIGIFKSLPTENLTDIVYFYEDIRKIKKTLDQYGRDDVRLHTGYLRPDFISLTTCGENRFNIPQDLRDDEEFQEYYAAIEAMLTQA